MKTKNFSEATTEINQAMDIFLDNFKKHHFKNIATISNIDLESIVNIYKSLPSIKGCKKQIYLPGEIGNENITIIFLPVKNCTIVIESESCIDYRWKVRTQKISLN